MRITKDTQPTLNIGMLSAKDGSTLRVKVARNGWFESYRLGEPTGSRINRVLAYHEKDRGYVYFDHRRYAIEFQNRANVKPKKGAAGFYEIHPGDVAVVSMKDKKRRPTTNGASQVYVIFDATTQSEAIE